MNVKLPATLRYLLLLAFGIGLLWLSFRGVDLRTTLDEFHHIHYGWLAVSIAVSLIAFYSRALRWKLLIEPLGFVPRTVSTYHSLMVGYLANLAVPRLGEVTRCGSLNRSDRVPFDVLLGTVIVERLLDVVCLMCCLFATAWLEHERLWDFLHTNILGPLNAKASYLFTIQGGILLLLLLIGMIGVVLWAIRNRDKGGLSGKFSKLVSGIVQGLRSASRIKKPGAFFFHTLLIWLMYFLMSYTCFKALPATASLGMNAGLFVLVVGGMGMSAPVQGGIGAYHLLVSRGLLLFGMAPVHGLAFATLMHTSQTLVVIVLGAVSMFYLSLLPTKDSRHVQS
ncbi:MAG: lysylphosphatidylglycerol synthase transmembrane domain-containing protein [Bacteroidota bacterium]